MRLGARLVADSDEVVALTEAERASVLDWPRQDAGGGELVLSQNVTNCPHKGQALHYNLIVDGIRHGDVAWSCPSPSPQAAGIAGRIAFYPDRVSIGKASDHSRM